MPCLLSSIFCARKRNRRYGSCSVTSYSYTSILDMDGNGRMGRFLTNLMMASGGYPWTVIPVGDRKIYIGALEKRVSARILFPLGDFLSGLVKKGLAGAPLPAVPTTES
jgi:hypothetical protein